MKLEKIRSFAQKNERVQQLDNTQMRQVLGGIATNTYKRSTGECDIQNGNDTSFFDCPPSGGGTSIPMPLPRNGG
ncbi:MAG: hypothetical protein AAF135_22210 [Bacteroidota bacterium]